jgi:Tol biopolymer transport system component
VKVSRKVLLSCVVGALVVAAASAPAWATFPGTNGRIAFESDGAGDLDIWTVKPDGTAAVNLTAAADAPAFDREPDWSPDGKAIAFRSGRGAAGEIYTMDSNGTAFTQLTSNTSIKDYSPAWSPDGSTIAFASNRNDPHPDTCIDLFGCNDDIFLMPATGGTPVQITFDSGADEFEQFSPDGRSIVYQTDAGGVYAVYKVNIHTLKVTKLTADSLRAGDPDYSPDGTKIAFINNFFPCKTYKECASDIFVMNADGSGATQLTQKFGDNTNPSWSPQGDKIVFSHENPAEVKPAQLYAINPDGTGLTRITHTNDNSIGPDWGSG